MHLSRLAEAHPDKAAVVEAETGAVLTFRELDERSIRLARLWESHGIGYGDHVAVLMDNTAAYFPVVWAAQRSGVVFTPVNHHLTAREAAYIVRDCGARALIASAAVGDLAAEVAALTPEITVRLMAGAPGGPPGGVPGQVPGGVPGQVPAGASGPTLPAGFDDLDAAAAAFPATERAGEREGYPMFYSSGTTGRPKGILPTLTGEPFGSGLRFDGIIQAMFGFSAETVYLCPAPLYHAAPTGWSMGTTRAGGTVVLLHRFDAERTLDAIERYRVSRAQFVPTMLVRLLKLPDDVRARYDLSSLEMLVHAAAPCPVDVKRRIIEWVGPIVVEYYAGSEGNAMFLIDSAQWLTHPGSVGRAILGTAHIVDDAGRELPPGEIGTVWFSDGPDFLYHNDPEKTASAHDDRGWTTLGDVGRLDPDGFLYLVDRRTDLILTGGVNIYPQEVENVLTPHPAVLDVAVIGAPDEEMGQRVRAFVQLVDPAAASPELAEEIIAYCRERLAHYKCPRTIEFVPSLPRTPTGKLQRRLLLDRPVPAAG